MTAALAESRERLVHEGAEHSGLTDLDGNIGKALAGQPNGTPQSV